MTSSTSVELVTFGCRLNAVESETISSLAGRAGLADTVIVNTCAVTSEAERQARQKIRRLKRERPEAAIVVTGCGAQIDPGSYAAMPEVAKVIGNVEKLQAGTWENLEAVGRVHVGNIFAAPSEYFSVMPRLAPRVEPKGGIQSSPEVLDTPVGPSGRRGTGLTRAFVEVQQGCDHRCTFCIIPYGRGPSRSVPVEEVIARIRAHLARGAAEAVLTGVDLTAWGADLPGRPTLAALVRRLLGEVPELARLRLSSLDPAEIGDALLELFARETRLMPHLHLSLQAGDDLILKRMKRRHSRAQAIDVIARVRQARPEIAIGADLIAGFPTEDEARFGRTLGLIDEAGLDFVHVFPFSPRHGTPAARMRQVAGDVVRDRAARLRAAALEAETRFLERQVGRTANVLVERSGRRGHAETFAPVMLSRPALPGGIVTVTVAGVRGRELVA